jgi:hypothetical protein
MPENETNTSRELDAGARFGRLANRVDGPEKMDSARKLERRLLMQPPRRFRENRED